MKNVFLVLILALTACSVERNLEATVTAKNGLDGSNGKNGHSLVSVQRQASELECQTSGSRVDLYIDTDDSLTASDSDLYQNSFVVCDGKNGLNGESIQGPKGDTGDAGEQGPQGVQGLVGPSGEAGQDGISCSISDQTIICGEDTLIVTNGSDGATGSQGPQGDTGSTGPKGDTGPAGSSGSSATITNYSSSSCVKIVGTSMYVKPTGSNNRAIYTSSSCASNTKQAEVSQGESYWVAANMLAVWYSDALRVITFN